MLIFFFYKEFYNLNQQLTKKFNQIISGIVYIAYIISI